MTDPVSTTCMRCAVGCGHVAQPPQVGHGVDTVRGDPAHPVNQGLACQRGISESADPEGEWLTRPLRREGDELVPTAWDRALSTAADRLHGAAADDPHAVAVLGSGQQTNEAAYALGKLARGGVGTRYYDANTTLCMASAVTAYYEAFGSDAPPPTYEDVPGARTHLVWGANPTVAHPVMFRWIRASAEEDDSQLVVVDPVESETAAVADRHVAPDPGTDLALARAVLARLVEDGGVDAAFVEAHTEGFDGLRAELPAPAAAAEAAGVPLAAVDALAASLDRPTLCYWGMGVNQSTQGTDTARALIDLCLASGNLGPGTGPFSLTGQANSMGTRVCSSKGTWPGHRPFGDPEHRRRVAEHWDVPVARLPDDPGPGPVGILDAVDDEVEVVYAVATNPAAGMPDANGVRDALEDAFVIVQDAFRSETVEYADVVLPAATWGESEGTAMNMERTVSRVRAATDTPPGVRPDLEIVARLAERVAPGLIEHHDPAATFEEFADLTAGTPADCAGIDYERLDAELAVRWPAPDRSSAGGYRYLQDRAAGASDEDADVESEDVDVDAADDADAADDEDADAGVAAAVDAPDSGSSAEPPSAGEYDWTFETTSGRAQFSTARHGGLPEPPDDDYPLLLTTGREPDRYNSGVRTRPSDAALPAARVSAATARATLDGAPATGSTEGSPESPPGTTALEARAVDPTCEPEDGAEEQVVRVASRRGAVQARVVVDDAVPDGIVWLPIHDPAVNELTLPAVDPRSDEPAFKQCAVHLEPLGARLDHPDVSTT